MVYLLGIDKGTSVIKAVVFDTEGETVGVSQRRVQVLQPKPGWHEEAPEATWALCAETIREALTKAGLTGADIAAIGIAGHMGGAWLIDSDGATVRNAICWPDERAQADQIAMEKTGLLTEVFAISGNGLMPGITAMLLGWLARHEPETVTRTRAVLCAKDFLRFRLTGEIATDPSDVSFVPGDIEGRAHSARVMELCGASAWMDKLPTILPSGAIAGIISAASAAETGLREGTPVVTGLGDACANALGVGAIRPGAALTVLGTSCLNSQVLGAPGREPEGLGFLFSMPLDRYLRILPNTSGTIAFDWFLERFGAPLMPDGTPDFTALEVKASGIARGAGGVTFIPYVNGSGVLAPFYDTLARGNFFGVGSHTSYDHLLRAVYEALCFATRDCFAAMSTRPQSLILTGGGAKSAFWSQLFADVCGLPIEIVATEESGALGVALLAGVAVGLWPDLETAAARTTRIVACYRPDPHAARDYDGWFDLYRRTRDVYRSYSTARADLRLVPEMAA
ncbi:sugar (pentulose or hexulose) kinase [Pararhizobium capsulatum DSM 1112]|uniref:Sugar (Pentulose or hexulose) kinase n=1 Tax=Pararhizobium capsulatum DSM 1112 TaxID=1121113 RepID=A0ABU0BYD2_9HYPH|nr:FGGY-family carbohydrate kinase [Pararhizobium capsulatum]MDQ0323276.1 sugar (pentulose or hexulose) kinase [Pararhizobium capsulatum DSM 1112]